MAEELAMGGRLEVFRHRLVAVAEQMGETLGRTAYSANIKERHDHSCAVFDLRGRLLAQAAHIPVHLGSMPASVEAVLRDLRLGAGDVAIVNDPYAGGTHLPDITLVTPIVVGERVVGYAANRAHHADVGGVVPGSMGVTTSIEQEGVRISPTKWYSSGVEDAGFRERFLGAVRGPAERLGDLRAQVAANEVGRRGIVGLIERYGESGFAELSDELLAYAERMVRNAIAEIPPGTYEAEDFLDGDGISSEAIRIAVRVGVTPTSVIVDFVGSAPQVRGCVNCPLAVTRSAVYYVFACLAGERLPHNAGMFAPIEVRAPEGSVVNAAYPAAVAAGNVETSQRVVDVVMSALAKAVPERVAAGAAGTMASISFGGVDPRSGREFTYYETIAGGMGASAVGAGASAVQTHMTNTLNTPIEALESAYPLSIERYEVRRGSGGAGRHRGGDGIVREIRALCAMTASILADRSTRGGAGLLGGGDGQPFAAFLIRANGLREALACKVTRKLEAGDRLRIETPGGGGYGTPAAK